MHTLNQIGFRRNFCKYLPEVAKTAQTFAFSGTKTREIYRKTIVV